MLNFDKPPLREEPRMFFIMLIARDTNGNVLMWHTALAAFNIDTAKVGATEALKQQDADMYNDGIRLGGWKVQNHLEMTVAKIDQVLEKAYGQKSELYEKQEKEERNELMQTIVETASRKLLNKYRDKFTSAEVGYLEDEIQKYETAS